LKSVTTDQQNIGQPPTKNRNALQLRKCWQNEQKVNCSIVKFTSYAIRLKAMKIVRFEML